MTSHFLRLHTLEHGNHRAVVTLLNVDAIEAVFDTGDGTMISMKGLDGIAVRESIEDIELKLEDLEVLEEVGRRP